MTARGLLGREHPSARRLPPQTAGAGRVRASRPALLSTSSSAPTDHTTQLVAPRTSGVAFVFQGGGSLAAGQVGMVRALTEAGVVADLVVGSSAGALNAVAFASRPGSDLEPLTTLWISLRRQHVAPFSARTIVRALTGHADGIFSHDALRAVIEDHLPPRLEDTAVPAHVVVTDMVSGRPVVLSGGATAPALLASSAFPGLYPPVTVAGRKYIDGGVSADVPVLQAEQLGASATFVLPAAASDDGGAPVRGPVTLAYRALGQILEAAARRDTSAARGQVHVLPAPTSAVGNPIDFRDTARLIDDGYRLATSWLAAGRDAGVLFPATPPAIAADAGALAAAQS